MGMQRMNPEFFDPNLSHRAISDVLLREETQEEDDEEKDDKNEEDNDSDDGYSE